MSNEYQCTVRTQGRFKAPPPLYFSVSKLLKIIGFIELKYS